MIDGYGLWWGTELIVNLSGNPINHHRGAPPSTNLSNDVQSVQNVCDAPPPYEATMAPPPYEGTIELVPPPPYQKQLRGGCLQGAYRLCQRIFADLRP